MAVISWHRRLPKLIAVSVLALAATTLVVTQVEFELAAKNKPALPPVLGLTRSIGETPFLNEALRDPELLRFKPEDSHDASRLASEIKMFRDDLSRAKGARARELHEQAYQGFVSLSYYLEDALQGKTLQAVDRGQALSQLQTARAQLLLHAGALIKSKANSPQTAAAQFHYFVTSYFLGRERAQAIGAMRKLAASRHTPPALRVRSRILVAVHELDHGTNVQRLRAASSLAASVKTLSLNGGIAVRLASARGFAGINKNGRRLAKSDPRYRAQLVAATRQLQGLSEIQNEMVLSHAVAVWQVAEGSSLAWGKPPFRLASFPTSPTVAAVVERAAIADWQVGRRSQAIKKYAAVARMLNATSSRAQVDKRLLDLQQQAAFAAKRPRDYERGLIAMQQAYLDAGILGAGNEDKAKAMQVEITRRHEMLVNSEIRRVSRQGIAKQDRLIAIEMANAFLTIIDDSKRIEAVKASIANLYALNAQHAEAVALYKGLAETGASGAARRYWALAIRSQSVLASWPEQAPWQGLPSGSAGEREELLNLYKKLAESSGQERNWFIAAQIGLLEIAQGRTEAAFAMWTEVLQKDSRGPHAANAAGTMLVVYRNAKAWNQLESTARLALQQHLRPVYRGRALVAIELLALALLEGGKQALAEGRYADAVQKLKEFVKEHPRAKNHDEGFFLLASAHRGAGQHKESIEVLLAFVERYPNSRFDRQALLDGGDWSAPMAFEDNAMFFYQRFAGKYPADAESVRVRILLSELYVGRGMYGEAVRILWQHARAKNVDAGAKAEALAKIMELEERQGSVRRAIAAADALIRSQSGSSAASSEAKADAYGLKARLAAKAGDVAQLRQLEAALSRTSAESPAMVESLGEVRFYLAMAQKSLVIKDHFNLALKDPLSTLEQRYKAFAGARVAHLRVCEAGQTSFCAPSLHELARLSEDFIKSIEDIAIQETLAKDVVNNFSARKQRIVNTVSAASQQADNRAVAVLSEGYTAPDWTQAILWQNTSDWNFDRVSGETGNAYVQWSVAGAGE